MFDNWFAWAAMAAVFFIYEMISPTVFFFACLGLGAIFASIATIFNLAWLNWVIFFTVSLLAIIFSRPIVNKLVKKPSRPANVDALINQNAFVLEEIKPTKFGRVKIEGEEWLAESSEEIQKGVWVKIIEVKGARLIVKKAEDRE
ncbi:MAG: NfeD family protein [Elusimicrobiota bacterium]